MSNRRRRDITNQTQPEDVALIAPMLLEALGDSFSDGRRSMRSIANPEDNAFLNLMRDQMRNRGFDFDDNGKIKEYKKTVYVTVSFKKQIRKACSSILSSSSIDISEARLGYETLMATNGERYIPVHLKTKRCGQIERAITIIEEHVGGLENIHYNINLATKEHEIIYVKASARRNLRIGAIKSGSHVDNIYIDYERLKASNGEAYVLVDILGSGEAIQKAIVMIKEQVGVDNYEIDIDLLDDTSEDNKKKGVPNTVNKENEKQHEIREKIRNGISNRENMIRENEARNKILDFVIVLGIVMIALTVTMNVSTDYWFIKMSKFSIQFIKAATNGCRLAVQKAFVLTQEGGSIDHVNWTINYGREWLQYGREWLQLRYDQVLLTMKYFSMMGCFIFALERYQAKRVRHHIIYVKSSQSNIITGKQGRRKRKGIINKSGVEDIQINTLSDSDDYLSVHVVGNRQSVQKAIALIREAVGVENVTEEYVSTDQSLRSQPTQNLSSSTAVAADISTDSEARPNQEDSELEYEVSAQLTLDNVSSDTPEAQEQNSSMPDTETASQEEQSTMHDDIHILVTEDDNAAADESSTPLKTDPVEDEAVTSTLEQPQTVKDEVQLPQQECVPTEIGINTSTQGMTTGRETITESSMSSFNDGSKASKELSTFTLNENDPLLIFLRSQHACIRGSVDDFYTWLVKSEYIDSMTALKEAVCDDDYYNDTMKVGSGSSGVKVFKRKVFKRALSEYEENGNKAPTTDLNDPPEELVCPISLVLMTNDPVVASDGITYEREHIEDWFKKNKAKGSVVYSPVHGTKLKNLTLTPHIGTRNMARAFKEKK